MSFDEQPDGDPHGECAIEIHNLQDRVAQLAVIAEKQREALRLFTGAKFPVSSVIDARGYSWVEAYLDQAIPFAEEALALDTSAADRILAERDAKTIERAVEIAGKVRIAFSSLYTKNIDNGRSEMGGNMDWARLEGAVKVFETLRNMASDARNSIQQDKPYKEQS